MNFTFIKHVRETHNDFSCNTCNICFQTAATANEHCVTSPAHFKCQISGVNFPDEDMPRNVCQRSLIVINYSSLGKPAHTYEPSSVNGNTTTSPSVSISSKSGTPTPRSPIYAPSTILPQCSPTSAVSSTVFSIPGSTSSQPKERNFLQSGTRIAPISSPPVGMNTQLIPHNGAAASFDDTDSPSLAPEPNIFNKVNCI